MLGSDKAGPASSRANAGPRPIPRPSRASRIGISVSVAKYHIPPIMRSHQIGLETVAANPTGHDVLGNQSPDKSGHQYAAEQEAV